MGRIQTNIGLVTGMPIGDTVDALIALAARPRDLLIQRTNQLQAEQTAVTELTALLLSVQYVAESLGNNDLFDQRVISSSDSAALTASLSGQPSLGTFQFTPLRMVQNQQLLGSGFSSDSDPLGGGSLSLRFGDHVQRSAALPLFDGGNGIARGSLRITDRSGAAAEIDLTAAMTVDDVLEAVNADNTINVTAVARGDAIRLIDNTGQTVSNLKVEEVGSGATAASLGLDGIDVAAASADGRDMLRLYADLDLNVLNDGAGVHADTVMSDIYYVLRDGTEGEIDLSPRSGAEVDEELTLGEILEVINAAAPGKLSVEIAPDGDRLIATDLTAGATAFTLSALNDSDALADLGLDGAASGGEISGRRIIGGAKTVLLSSLGGKQGLGVLGSVQLTDRSGATDTVDLSAAETLDDVVQAANAAGVGILARVNPAKNGIELIDTTGASAGNLVVANADATLAADKLGIAVDDDVSSVNSGDLHLQVVADNTRLEGLNGGAGVAGGTLEIRDSTGKTDTLDLRGSGIETIGDVIVEINRLDLDIYAEINETGDGIRIVDTGAGHVDFRILDGAAGTAADLHLLGDVQQIEIGGQTRSVIDGSATYTVELEADDSLTDLRDKLNGLDAGVTAMILNDGSSKPHRLSIISDRSGKAGELVIDTSGIGFSLEETSRAQDALLLFGDPGLPSSSFLASSPSNVFIDVLPGATLLVRQASESPVTVRVETTDSNLIANVKAMVQNYNGFREKLLELTKYDVEANSGSILTGNGTALRLDVDLSYLLSGRIAGAGAIQSLAELGIGIKSDGTLEFDESKLRDRYARDPSTVEAFFTTEEFGFAGRFKQVIERLSGEDSSLISNRLESLQDKISDNQDRITFLNERLAAERQRLLEQFYRMEIAIGKMQNSLAAIESIQALEPLAMLGD